MVATWQLGEFVGEVDAAVRVLGRDEVEGHLDARRDIAHLPRQAASECARLHGRAVLGAGASRLVRASGGDEDGVALALDEPPAAHAVLVAQPASQRRVEIEELVVDRIARDLDVALARDGVEKLEDRVGVLPSVDVPDGARRLAQRAELVVVELGGVGLVLRVVGARLTAPRVGGVSREGD